MIRSGGAIELRFLQRRGRGETEQIVVPIGTGRASTAAEREEDGQIQQQRRRG